MTANNEPTIESLRATMTAAGLPLPDDEAAALLKGIQRNQEMAAVVSTWVSLDVEPALTFNAGEE